MTSTTSHGSPMRAPLSPTELRAAWDRARAEQEMARPYDVAAALGVSELELVESRLGDGVVRVRPDWDALLPELKTLGEVMALTRNPHAVIEKHGVWSPFSRHGGMGLVLDEGLDLRLFFAPWKRALAVSTDTPRGKRRSLQIFDGHGSALHKIFVREPSARSETASADESAATFDALAARFADPDQATPSPVEPAAALPPERPDSEVDVAGFQQAWRDLEDTHAFFGMLKKFDVQRTQAFRLAPEGHARPVAVDNARKMLEHAAASAMPIMVFVGNRGCIEIHTGPVRKVKVIGPWLNVLDPGFNLHVREDHIAAAWVVTKPTADGPVTSLELYDAAGHNIALLFGKRKPGLPESPAWRAYAQAMA